MLGKLKILGEILIVTVSAYCLASGVFLFIKPAEITLPDTAAIAPAINLKQKAGRAHFEVINNRNLFAAFDPAKVVKPKPKPKPKPVNDLASLPVATNYRLIGTVYASDPLLRRAVVIIDGRYHVLKKGEQYKDIIISEVKRRAVVLTRGGRKEIIMIDGDDKKIAAKSDSGDVLLNRKKMGKVISRPEDILSKVDFAPAKVDGQKGLLINGVADDSVLADIGIKEGDLIVSVNGQGFNSMADLMNMAKMRVKDSIEIKIWRNKRFETLKLKFSNA
ncbi:PDZ domain-containing protein [Desulfovibrio sp. JC022]|uniref:PDZ domain-containing protein n=1 Tax=Desulfovibrio sp. JC022 TaxID=2593642 RepID=UPI0013CFBD44|nr:PDZ domain-containing protein [Desulfovibrio sp. JC022]NDV24921.1 PDZ domain-containing protein [Desulfovibrio sp. JC022]